MATRTQSLSLLLIALLVTAVTALNSYVTVNSADYFTNATIAHNRDMARIKATHDAQLFATEALVGWTIEQDRAVRFEGLAEEYKSYALHFRDQLLSMQQLLNAVTEYVQTLESLLQEHNIPLPEAKIRVPN